MLANKIDYEHEGIARSLFDPYVFRSKLSIGPGGPQHHQARIRIADKIQRLSSRDRRAHGVGSARGQGQAHFVITCPKVAFAWVMRCPGAYRNPCILVTGIHGYMKSLT